MQQEQIPFSLADGQTIFTPVPEPAGPPYEPTPNDPPWGVTTAFVSWLVSVFLLIFVGNIGVVIYAISQNVAREDLEAFLMSPNVILIAIASVIPAHILTLIYCWVVVTKKGKYSLSKTLGFKWGKFHFGYALLTVVVFYAIFGTLAYFLGDEDHQLMKILRSSRAASLIVAFLATFTAPVVEETVYRGIIYSAFQRTFGIPLAIGLTSLLFAGVHFAQYSTSATAIIMICILSLGLTLIRARSGNLLPCIVTHMIFNGLQGIVLVLQPYLEDPATAPVPVEALIRSFTFTG
ncbi:MAG TPA: type II CAAX endopeptidase family protein [Pyrinomonadaceae bacterium]|jgi:membrane protease YdiL (CAAX protease family)|nr:type II CAAX endopeptidase family protein [Pyrinomonadaceae bacterium]